MSACIYHADDVCSSGEVQDPATDACVCAPNSVPVKRPITVLVPQPRDPTLISMCVPCGANEQVVGGACVCAQGFVKGRDGCVVTNLGATCGSDQDCLDGDATHCQVGGGTTAGYCTTIGCTANQDCTGANYACVMGASDRYCRRPPLNEGNDCAAQGLDPTCGAEAPVCLLGHCTFIGCATDADCSSARKCCDLSHLQAGAPPACLETCL